MVKTYDADCDGYLVESDNGIVVRVEDYEELKRESERLNTKLSAWLDMAKKELGLNKNEEQDIEWSRMVVRQVIAENEQLKAELNDLKYAKGVVDYAYNIESAARAVERAGELIRYEMEGPKDCDSLEEFLDNVAAKVRKGEIEL